MLQFVVSRAPQASALWKIWAQWDLEAECLGTAYWGLVTWREVHNYTMDIRYMSRDHFYNYIPWVLGFLPCHQIARDNIVQSLGSLKGNNRKTKTVPSDPEHLQLQSQCLRSQIRSLNINMTTDSPLLKQWLYSPKSLSLFDTAGGATLNSATVLDDWTMHLLFGAAVYWLPLDLSTTPANTTFSFIRVWVHFFLKSTCPRFQKIYKK